MQTPDLDRLSDEVKNSLLGHLAFRGESVGDILIACVKGYDTFTAWTSRRVYFPATYDGDVWVTSVPRDPCDWAMEPVGG
jgi:hypothetical protein